MLKLTTTSFLPRLAFGFNPLAVHRAISKSPNPEIKLAIGNMMFAVFKPFVAKRLIFPIKGQLIANIGDHRIVRHNPGYHLQTEYVVDEFVITITELKFSAKLNLDEYYLNLCKREFEIPNNFPYMLHKHINVPEFMVSMKQHLNEFIINYGFIYHTNTTIMKYDQWKIDAIINNCKTQLVLAHSDDLIKEILDVFSWYITNEMQLTQLPLPMVVIANGLAQDFVSTCNQLLQSETYANIQNQLPELCFLHFGKRSNFLDTIKTFCPLTQLRFIDFLKGELPAYVKS